MMNPNTYIIVGLGNPGAEYARTRHNLGFMVLDNLASRQGIKLDTRTKLYYLGRGQIEGKDVILAEPRTYMNLSGQAVKSLSDKYKVDPCNIIVLVDDMRIPLGRIRMRKSGGSGGHNGLTNIIECLGTQEFPRLRLGLGEPPAGLDYIDFVLKTFLPDEWEHVNSMTERAAEALEFCLKNGYEATMDKYNRADS